MPRAPRLDPPGSRHHVMNRGARRQQVFFDDEDRLFFLDCLSELPTRFGVQIHGYCLMPNHFHLLVASMQERLSGAIGSLSASYSRTLNRRHGWDGPVWRSRFRSRLVTDDRYWQHLLAYVHLNPVRAGLVGGPDDWPWSSHGAYLRPMDRPAWLDTDELRGLHGGGLGYEDYLRRVQCRPGAPEGFHPESLWRPEEVGETRSTSADRPHSDRSPEDAVAEVVERLGCDREALHAPGRGGCIRRERWVAAWWLARSTQLTQGEIGGLLAADGSLVSRWVQRVRAVRLGAVDRWGLLELVERLDSGE